MWISELSEGTRPNLLLNALQGVIQGIKLLLSLGLAGMILIGGILVPHLWEDSLGEKDAASDALFTEPIYELELSEQDNLLILRTRQHILFRDLQSGALIHQLPAPPHLVSSSWWISRTQQFLVGYGSGRIELWDTRGPWEASFTEHVHQDEIRAIAISPDGWLAATGSSDRICLWDLERKQLLAEAPMQGAAPDALQFSPNGEQLLAGCDDGGLHLFQGKDLQWLRRFQRSSLAISQATFIAKGTRILAGNLEGRVFVLDSDTGQVVWETFPCRLQLLGMAVSPDQSLVALTDWSDTIHLYSLKTFEKIDNFVGHQQAASTVQFSGNNEWLYSASYDGTVRIWDVNTFAELACFQGTLPAPED